MIDRTRKRDGRDARREKRHGVNGRSLEHILNAIRNRAEKAQKGRAR